MMMVLLIAGIGALIGGVVAIASGIPVKEFSFGNTLIVAGAMAACTGAIMIALAVVVGELKTIARRLASSSPAESRVRAALASTDPAAADDDFEFPRDPSSAPPEAESLEAAPPLTAPPWNGRSASRARPSLQPTEPGEPAAKPRRNLVFASASRKERERGQARTMDAPVSAPPVPPPMPETSEPSPNFDEPWPKPERMRLPESPPRRGGRTPPTFTEPNGGPGAASARDADQPTVLKSGVVDGMAYSLYSDGSIEAQLPEGTMRFGSIDELRAHLDQRPR